MSALSRRGFLAGSAAMIAHPALAQRGRPSELDCIIVGAGAAGIAAARRFAAAGRSFVLVEASNRIGGRCFAENSSFGVAFDRGAHFIFNPDGNPLTKLAPRNGLDIYPASLAQRIRIGHRYARDGELEDFLAATVRANRSIADAVRGRPDMDCAKALPPDLGEWRSTLEFALGPYAFGKDLGQISATDFSRSVDRDNGAYCRQGFGALLARLAQGVPVQLDTAVKAVDITTRGTKVEAVTTQGAISARNIIITASTNVLASGRIKFGNGLPKPYADAFDHLRLGSFDHIALDMPGNPLGLQNDDLVFEKSNGPRTAALLANVSGTSLSIVDVGGRFGRDLAAQGDKAMVEFAVEWLSGLFGTDVKNAVKRTQTTQWDKDPWTLGAFATASPGGQAARRVLMEPLRGRVYFAGEAVHDTHWGTVGGAWESGTRAADIVVRRLLGQPEPRMPETEGSNTAERIPPRGKRKR